MKQVVNRASELRAAALAGCLALAGCAVGPNYHTPDMHLPQRYAVAPPAVLQPAAGAQGSASATPVPQVDIAAWWRSLNDPELDSLVERAIKSNPDLEIALDRLQAARTYEVGVVSSFLPDMQASAGAGRGTGSDLARGRASQPLISADNSSGLQHINQVGGFDTVWELDLFGKLRREAQAARYDTEALAAERNGVLVSVIADLVRAYVDLRGLQVRAAVLHAASDSLRESLRIVNIRYQRGITNELDVTLATREFASLEAQIAPVEAQIGAAQYTIAVLLGRYPEDMVQELAGRSMVPAVPAVVDSGVPVDLLRRRPDVQQAERELAGATARIGVATAELFPQVALTGAIGYQRQDFGSAATPALGQHIWSAGPAAVWPLLDFGALDAQVDIADLQTRARLVGYRQTIQHAVEEVDSTVASFNAQQIRLSKLDDAMVASQRAVSLAKQRYERGLTDFLNVVDAEREEYDIEEQYTDAQVGAAEQFVALYRNLGGGWENYQKLPPIRRPQPAVIAAFRRVLTRDTALQDPAP